MPTWSFKTAERHTRDTSTRGWYWQIDTSHAMIAIASTRLFPTVGECIANARQNGFRGEVEIPETLTDATVITCEEGDYVHGIVERSISGRANRAAV